MLDQNEMEEKQLREKIQLYFSKRQDSESGNKTTDDDAMFDEDSSQNNDRGDIAKGGRNPAGVRVRDTTRRGVSNKLKASKGLASTYMSEPVPRKLVKQ